MNPKELKKLPDAEFEIMRAVWHSDEPVTSSQLMQQLQETRPGTDWKPQTVLTMLTRLEKKGFLYSEKHGRERGWYAQVSEELYLQTEAHQLRQRFSGGRFTGLVKALCDTGDLTQSDIDELRQWLAERSQL